MRPVRHPGTVGLARAHQAALAVLGAVSAGGITYAPADTAAGMVHGLVALAVVFLVFNPASSRHYRTSMRNRSSLA